MNQQPAPVKSGLSNNAAEKRMPSATLSQLPDCRHIGLLTPVNGAGKQRNDGNDAGRQTRKSSAVTGGTGMLALWRCAIPPADLKPMRDPDAKTIGPAIVACWTGGRSCRRDDWLNVSGGAAGCGAYRDRGETVLHPVALDGGLDALQRALEQRRCFSGPPGRQLRVRHEVAARRLAACCLHCRTGCQEM